MAGEIALNAVWWEWGPDGQESSYIFGQRGVEDIKLRQDGNGLSGLYDRIHVYLETGDHLIFPAHHVHGWRVR